MDTWLLRAFSNKNLDCSNGKESWRITATYVGGITFMGAWPAMCIRVWFHPFFLIDFSCLLFIGIGICWLRSCCWLPTLGVIHESGITCGTEVEDVLSDWFHDKFYALGCIPLCKLENFLVIYIYIALSHFGYLVEQGFNWRKFWAKSSIMAHSGWLEKCYNCVAHSTSRMAAIVIFFYTDYIVI